MTEFALRCLADGNPKSRRTMIAEMARRWPKAPALAIGFSVTSAAASLEEVLEDDAAIQAANEGYKLAALVAADVHALQSMGHVPAYAQDLLHFWRRFDPYFLRLGGESGA